MRRIVTGASMLAWAARAANGLVGGEPTVPEEYTWNLSDLYPTTEAFEAARKDLLSRLGDLERYRGTLGASARAMQAALDAVFSAARDLGRISTYASLRSDEDTRVPETLAARQEVQQLATDYAAGIAWLAPEILALPEGAVARFLVEEPALEPYRFFLEDLERQRAHTLSPPEEKLLAEAGSVSRAASTLYTVLANAELPFPEVTLSDGRAVRLDQAGYARYRSLPRRADRKLVFETFWPTFKAYERTLGVALDAQVKRDVFYARARHYPSCLAAALDAGKVPEAVYRTLIAEANRALPTLHRAFRLRARMLEIHDLEYYDVYPPLVGDLDLEYPVDKGEALVLDALRPLGPEYVKAVKHGFGSRWMDVYPRSGKRSGAYSSGSAYDVHPYVLLNYNDDYESVSTLAHEWGHAMHSYLANQAQPFATADYSIFVAEVASTFNEALLLERMLKEAPDDGDRLFLLGNYLEGLRGTFFRQAMFAEFELAIHETAERGEALTGERLSMLYAGLLRRYHGSAEGVMEIGDLYTVEWAYIPHFYYNFYVYQYATSLAASALLSAEVLDDRPGARERYLAILEAGGSRYPFELMRDAGVDLATAAPYRSLIEKMNWTMDQMETILARRGTAGPGGRP